MSLTTVRQRNTQIYCYSGVIDTGIVILTGVNDTAVVCSLVSSTLVSITVYVIEIGQSGAVFFYSLPNRMLKSKEGVIPPAISWDICQHTEKNRRSLRLSGAMQL